DAAGDLPVESMVEPAQPPRETADAGASSGPFESPDYDPHDQGVPASSGEQSQGTGRVERGLVAYAFVREEREREVRLSFRDVPADDLAAVFRSAGARLISLSGGRASTGESHLSAGDNTPPEEGAAPPKRKRRRKPSRYRTGDLSLRYFYALGDVVYTVTIATTTEVMHSISAIFPAAILSERELQDRLSIVFTRPGGDE
ncbi:MAG TPA: hypothetical protein VM409_07595, partial [Chloroflexia bacterium]|nr:hypothetical protein [Chloroflexia bacterium]